MCVLTDRGGKAAGALNPAEGGPDRAIQALYVVRNPDKLAHLAGGS